MFHFQSSLHYVCTKAIQSKTESSTKFHHTMYKNNNSCKFYSETSLPFVIKKCLPGSFIDFFLSKATASRRRSRSSDVLSGQMNAFLNCATFFSRFADSRSSVIGGMSRTGSTNSKLESNWSNLSLQTYPDWFMVRFLPHTLQYYIDHCANVSVVFFL